MLLTCCGKAVAIYVGLILVRLGYLKGKDHGGTTTDRLNPTDKEEHTFEQKPETVYQKDKYNVYVYSGPQCEPNNQSQYISELTNRIEELNAEITLLKDQQSAVKDGINSLQESFQNFVKSQDYVMKAVISLTEAFSQQKDALLEQGEQLSIVAETITDLNKAHQDKNGGQNLIMDAIMTLKTNLVDGGGHVYHVESPSGAYRYSKQEARVRCEREGMTLATSAQLKAAFDKGMHSCRCGWLKDGTVAYPIQWPRDGCGGDTTEPGIRACAVKFDSKFDAYCFK